MVGKPKQANRTKNNARPSSSSHSAQLLGNTIPTFFGFSVAKDGGPSISGFPTKEAKTSIHSDFQIMFKQMSKKDPTTRFKALQMFTDLCNNLDVNTVVEMLPLWPRTYCTLCTDIEHKVREAAHKAHHAVVSKVKKMIAPYLKELAGPWFTSQYDTYPPAASAATLAFEEAFPAEKYNKAIIFCQNEILSYIYDNLINQTAQTLSGPNTSAEDMEAKYERIIISSLQGYNLYLQKLSTDQIKQAEENNKKLLSNPKFWKYSKNKVPAIRNSFFHTVITLCQNAKFLLAEESVRLSSAVFNNLDESDPLVLQTVWEAALNVLVTIDDCWSHINIEKQVFSKLFFILKNGGRNVATIYPNILPLLSKLPENLIKDKETFYGNLFDNLRRGLSLNFVNQSNSDEKIIANTFTECLKYTIMRNSSDEQFCVSLVSNQLIPALEQKLKENKTSKKTPTTPFFLQTACLVRYWHSNRNTGNSTHEKLVELFFSSLFNIFTQHINAEISRSELEDILNNHSEFLIVLSRPDQFSPKNKGRVKFQEDAQEEKPETVEFKSNDSEFEMNMLPIAKKLGVFYFKNAIEKQERNYIRPLNKLMSTFDAGVIFEEMTMAVNESSPFKLFAEYFSKWLMKDDMKCDELVVMSLKLLSYVTQDEKEYILDEFCRNWFTAESSELSFNVCKVLSSYFNDDFVVNWIRSEQFAKNIINLVERFVKSDGKDSALRDVIVSMLKSRTGKGDFIISSTVVDMMVDIVSKNIDKGDEDISHLVDLSQDLISRTKVEGIVPPSFEVLVAALFKLSCQKPENENLSQVCKAGLSIVLSRCQDSGLEFARKLSKVVKEVIFGVDDGTVSLDRIVTNINSYLKVCNDTNPKDSGSSNPEMEKNMEIVKIFIKNETDLWKQEETVEAVEKICRIGYENNEDLDFEYLESVNYLRTSSDENVPAEKENKINFELEPIKKYAKWSLFVGRVLNRTVAGHPESNKDSTASEQEVSGEGDEEGEDSGEEKNAGSVKDEESKSNGDPEVVETVCQESEQDKDVTLRPLIDDVSRFLVSVGLFESFIKYYGSTRQYYKLEAFISDLKTIACDLLKNVSLSECQFIYNHCKVFISRKSTWWLVRNTFREVFNRSFPEEPEEVERADYELGKRYFDEFKELDFTKMPMDPGNYLKISSYVERGFGHLIAEAQWDRIFIYMHNFIEGFLKKEEFSESDLLTLSSVARLFSKLTKTFSENHTKPHEERIPRETCLAWSKIVQTEVYNKFLSAWRVLSKKCYDQQNITPEWYVALENVSDVVVTGSSLRKMESLSENVDFAFECLRCMVSPHAVVQITSFRLCLSLVPVLVQSDAETFGDNVTQTCNEDENSLFERLQSDCSWMFKKFGNEFVQNQGFVEILLSDFKIGDCCTVEPFTDSFTYIYSYLLFSCFLMEMCGQAHLPLRFQYGCWLMDSGYYLLFLQTVFKLMPQEVLHGSEAMEKFQKYFESYGSLDFREIVQSERIKQMACYAYRLFLARLPNVTREWWIQTESKTFRFVDKVTRLYVSPILISLEFKNLNKEADLDQMEVKSYFSSREVIATYTVDDVKMDIILTLPANYPLGTINIESTSKMLAVSNSRSLLFHLSKYFFNQNGTIWDALAIWKSNLDKKFHGREECYICFSIVQGSSFEIPRLSCHTCKKKFHSSCLYKWFNTSNKSTCPICRNLF